MNPRGPQGIWNEEVEERFRALWTEGKTASRIAALLGTTRSAICAKARRLNLPMRAPTGGGRPRPQRAREARSRGDAHVATSKGPPVDRRLPQERTMPRPQPPAPPPLAEPTALVKADGTRFTVMDLTDKVCRWPIGTPGDDDFHFCANPADGHYCLYHERQAWQPLQHRWRRAS